MKQLKPLQRPGKYLACVSFTGSTLDSELLSVMVGKNNDVVSVLQSGSFHFESVETFNEAFMPVFEGSRGYGLEITGIPVIYGYKQEKKADLNANGLESTTGCFLDGTAFSKFDKTLNALPSVRALRACQTGWKACLVETDEDLAETLCANNVMSVKKGQNVWIVVQRENGEYFLTNRISELDGSSGLNPGESTIGFMFTEKPYKGQEKIKIELTTEADVELAESFVKQALDNLASRV